jgi:hypothetical protein
MTTIPRYGVKEQNHARDDVDVRVEELRLLGYTTLDSGADASVLDKLSADFKAAQEAYVTELRAKGVDLAAVGEQDTIRVLPVATPQFWDIVFNDRLHTLLTRILGDYYILNQVNGLTNAANRPYTQAAYHRDLPYQHFVSSRPLAINALFALDDFTMENGATRVIPASHKMEAFPSEETVRRNERQIEVPRGTFILLDCMVYHAGSPNRSDHDRRAVNHVFTIPMLRQQLHIPSILQNDSTFSEWQRKVLGFGLDEFRSIDAWFAARSRKG